MIEWVKDVDSGELFPVDNCRDFDIPEHLKQIDFEEIDYDKTHEMTITQLQEQLTTAQEQIKIMTATPVVQPSCEDIIIENKTELEFEDNVVSKHKDFSNPLMLIIIVLLCFILFGVFLSLKNNYDEDIQVQSQYVEEVAVEVAEEENELSKLVEMLESPVCISLVILITSFCIRLCIKFIRISVY